MSCTAKKLVSVAVSQIGTKEGKNNDNKYGKAYGWNNVAWCVIFVWWCFLQAGAPGLFYGGKKTASCTAVYNWAKSAGLLVSVKDIRPGDLLLFKFSSNPPDHIGIAESAGSSRITSIEGNTSSGNSGSQSNGDGVYRRYRTVSQIYAVIRPKYDPDTTGTTPAKEESCSVNVLMLKKGSKGNTVRSAQALLRYRHGYKIDVDGDFGSATDAAVRAFQRAKGLAVDGVIGSNTWSKLISG